MLFDASFLWVTLYIPDLFVLVWEKLWADNWLSSNGIAIISNLAKYIFCFSTSREVNLREKSVSHQLGVHSLAACHPTFLRIFFYASSKDFFRYLPFSVVLVVKAAANFHSVDSGPSTCHKYGVLEVKSGSVPWEIVIQVLVLC